MSSTSNTPLACEPEEGNKFSVKNLSAAQRRESFSSRPRFAEINQSQNEHSGDLHSTVNQRYDQYPPLLARVSVASDAKVEGCMESGRT